MSYSIETKNEVAVLAFDSRNFLRMELSGFMRTAASISISFRDELSIYFKNETSSVSRRIFKILKQLYDYEARILVVKNNQLRKKSLYKVLVDDEDVARFILEDSGYNISDFGIGYKDNVEKILEFDNDLEKKSYLRGTFLGAGSITDPKKEYHLEVVFNTEASCKFELRLANDFFLKAGMIKRKDKYVFYIKDSSSISDFLSIIGANKAMFELENIIAFRDIRNNINRVVNFEVANLDKTLDASGKQLAAIEYLYEIVGLENLPESLQEISEIRLRFPNESLKALGEMMSPPLGKSGVNHRMKKLIDLAKEKGASI